MTSGEAIHPGLAALAPGTTELVLVRHGDALGDATRVGVGYDDQPLSSLGRAQAATVPAGVLSAGQVHAVWSSPLARAVETAQPLAAATGLRVRLEDRLRELRTPVDTLSAGTTAAETAEALRAQVLALASALDPEGRLVDAEGLEPRSDFRSRVAAVLRDAVAAHPGGRVVLVAHGLWIATAIALATGARGDVPAVVHHASVSGLLVTADGTALPSLVNGVSHLRDAGVAITTL